MTNLSNLELSSLENEIVNLSFLLQGAEAVVIIFCSCCFGELKENSMETFLTKINGSVDLFNQNDIRLVCITNEPPSTNRHWTIERDWKFEVYSDITLEVSNALIGTFDLSTFFKVTKGVDIGNYMCCIPGIVMLSADGKQIGKMVFESPDSITVTPEQILALSGIVP